MKKIDIMPCICSEGDIEKENEHDGGMPIFRPSRECSLRPPYQRFWSYKCPDCGRGGFGLTEEKSLYYAIKAWNEMQINLRKLRDDKFFE